MVADPSLTRDDKLSGLRTWRNLVLRDDSDGDDRERSKLMREIDRSLELLVDKRPD
jgi:hypothetical protein